MEISEKRLGANRQNALKSSGPKTPEGKAISRGNSCTHGMTGSGVVVKLDEEAQLALLLDELTAKHQPDTLVGHALVGLAARLFVRLNRCGLHEQALVRRQVRTAVCEFDQFRLDHADELFASLEANPKARVELLEMPEGIDLLIAEVSDLLDLKVCDLARAARLLGTVDDPSTVRDRLQAEIARLESAKAGIDRRPIDIARQEAADFALFGTSREEILFRRYDAATARQIEKTSLALEIETARPEPVAQAPEAPTPTAKVGSFRTAAKPVPKVEAAPVPVVVPILPEPQANRPNRPDPKKLREARRRNRRR